MNAIIPTDITLNHKSNELLIEWSDGLQCQYPLSALRLACPCAECRGGHENMGQHNDPENLLDLVSDQVYTVQHLEIVGNYALQFQWSDGHSSGIYTWDYLRRLCPSGNE